jgi:hypothetical protein
MTRRTFQWLAALLLTAGLTGALQGQTAQRFSLQGSGLFAGLFGDAFAAIEDGFGAELQVRFTPGKWSFGGGVQHTSHGVSDEEFGGFVSKVTLTGVFLEPRYVIDVGSSSFAPYLSARLALSRMKLHLVDEIEALQDEVAEPTGPTINGGGGVLVRLGARANLDLGATFGYTEFGNSRFGDLVVEVGSGTNLILRLGLAIGLGG